MAIHLRCLTRLPSINITNTNNTTNASNPLHAIITAPIVGEFSDEHGAIRLALNDVSTLILEGALAFVVICLIAICVVSTWPIGNIRVLRGDPGSIMANLRLFRGSRMVRVISEGVV